MGVHLPLLFGWTYKKYHGYYPQYHCEKCFLKKQQTLFSIHDKINFIVRFSQFLKQLS
jgi:hypothetical protein